MLAVRALAGVHVQLARVQRAGVAGLAQHLRRRVAVLHVWVALLEQGGQLADQCRDRRLVLRAAVRGCDEGHAPRHDRLLQFASDGRRPHGVQLTVEHGWVDRVSVFGRVRPVVQCAVRGAVLLHALRRGRAAGARGLRVLRAWEGVQLCEARSCGDAVGRLGLLQRRHEDRAPALYDYRRHPVAVGARGAVRRCAGGRPVLRHC